MIPIHISSACTLLVIDVQERLLAVMDEAERDSMLSHTETLVHLARHVGADIVYTEQYPKGLGGTEPSLLEVLTEAGATRVEKVHFDACTSPAFREPLEKMRRRVIMCGMETHICVLSTARSLMTQQHDVLVPFDAVTSRSSAYKQNGLELMREDGAIITNTETLVFGTLGYSQHPEFKRFSKMIQ
ncbi:MAG: isochorismatase family protein [Myxococcota bacterium]|jgi:nicotinamidase-related amidase|nr:isochorismatase family protein [Myxococcota bacterium]